jgi:hypothetical protein
MAAEAETGKPRIASNTRNSEKAWERFWLRALEKA